MHLAHYLGLLHRAQTELANAFREVADAHRDEADVFHACERARAAVRPSTPSGCAPFAQRYGEEASRRAGAAALASCSSGTRTGGIGLLRDLHDLYLMAGRVRHGLDAHRPGRPGRARRRAARGRRSAAKARPRSSSPGCAARMKQAAPQALVVAR